MMFGLDALLDAFLNTPWSPLGFEVGVAPRVVLVFVGLLMVGFVLGYVVPAVVFLWTSGKLRKGLTALQGKAAAPGPEDVAPIFSRSRRLKHLWSEYAETLHEQFETRDGERRRVQVRATVPAEMFFTPQALVDTTLRTEFFKHLPGILTGIGIIGTFYGLVHGLSEFKVDLNPDQLQASIGLLMAAVMEAFFASGLAIFMAMAVTLVEKLFLASCYRSAERLAHSIDALYDAGAGEEYLARLVNSAEESAAQTRMLKDSLVDDLRQMLTELTERQIAASREHGEALAGNVGGAIRESLQEPMTALQKAVGEATSSAGEASHKILGDLIAGFTDQLQRTVGGQMREMQDMMAATTKSIGDMQGNFADLLGRMEQTSSVAGERMAQQMMTAIEQSEARQQQMNEALLAAVRDMRAQVTGGQQDMQAQLASTLDTLRTTLEEMLTEIRRQREETAAATGREMAQVRESLQQAAEAMRAASREVGQSATDSVVRLLQEAEERQERLSGSLTRALDEMARMVTASSGDVTSRTAEALGSMEASMADMLAEIRNQREEVARATQGDLEALRVTLAETADAMRGTTREIGAASAEQINHVLKQAADWQARQEEKSGNALDHMAGRLEQFLAAVESRETEQSRRVEEQQQALAARTAEVLEALDKRLSGLATASSQAVQSMQSAIDALNGATGRAIDGMNRGAETMRVAADGFAAAGDRMQTTVSRTGELLTRIVEASKSLDSSVRAVESVVESYNGTRDAMKGLAATLETLVQEADDRAGVSRDLVASMQRVVGDFQAAEKEMGHYLDQVGEVLQQGFTEFSDAVARNMSRSRGEFDKSLSEAVQMISHQIQELEAVLSSFTAKAKAVA
ncbi:anti-phage ZorAB system protein ZorA [Novispirillum sp. DQ9]|uniref:anti-phage ZorAB system protein ZorA n=1 Tax=Novispirillum sp. DQ9 TaxID=3398612 RepID=UPI003C79D048